MQFFVNIGLFALIAALVLRIFFPISELAHKPLAYVYMPLIGLACIGMFAMLAREWRKWRKRFFTLVHEYKHGSVSTEMVPWWAHARQRLGLFPWGLQQQREGKQGGTYPMYATEPIKRSIIRAAAHYQCPCSKPHKV